MFVMSGLVPGIHVFTKFVRRRTWMAGTSPAMTSSLMRPCQTKRHHLLERGLHRGSRKQRQRIDRHRPVMLGAVEGVLERAVFGHQADGVVEIAVADLAALQRIDP